MAVLLVLAILVFAPHEDLRWQYRIEVPADWVQDATKGPNARETSIFRSPDKLAAVAIIPLASEPSGPRLQYADIQAQRQGGLPVRSQARRTVNGTEFVLEFRGRDDTHRSKAQACIDSFEAMERGVERSNGNAATIPDLADTPTTTILDQKPPADWPRVVRLCRDGNRTLPRLDR